MELLQLKYFFESAKTENFSKTAQKYTVPTTAVSSSVKRLEDELGCKLFDRSANKITLNASGKRLQQSLCLIFKELDGAIADLGFNDDQREIKLLVRAIRSDVTDYVIEFNKKYPRTVFKTAFDFSTKNYEDFDIIIDEQSANYIGYEKFELCNLRIKMKVAKDSQLLSRRLKLSDLASSPFISWGENSNMHRILESVCRNAGFTPNVIVRSNDKECYEKLLRAGVGIGLGRENPSADFQDLGYLDLVDFDKRYIVNCYYKKQSNYGTVKKFTDFLKTKR